MYVASLQESSDADYSYIAYIYKHRSFIKVPKPLALISLLTFKSLRYLQINQMF